MSALAQMLSDDAIGLDVEVEDWQAAVRAAGRLLENAGVADAAYTQAMIDSVGEHGPYIVIAPGFAFPHARPSEAVHRTGLSWLRLAAPVTFGHSSNDPVTLVVALAAKDDNAHTEAMAELAKVIGDPTTKAALDAAGSAAEIKAALGGVQENQQEQPQSSGPTASSRNLILTVCGNGLGTSLFLKNTLEQVLDRWGWSGYLTVEATDTISARGKAKDADLILTSGEIARTLGDVGIPVKVVENFTSTTELDAAMRELYDV